MRRREPHRRGEVAAHQLHDAAGSLDLREQRLAEHGAHGGLVGSDVAHVLLVLERKTSLRPLHDGREISSSCSVPAVLQSQRLAANLSYSVKSRQLDEGLLISSHIFFRKLVV